MMELTDREIWAIERAPKLRDECKETMEQLEKAMARLRKAVEKVCG